MLESLIGRRIERGAGPLHHRVEHWRHSRDRDAAGIDQDLHKRSIAEWWGAESMWFPAGSPPRQCCRITPLIDGANYLPALMEALSSAEHSITVAGWCLTSHIPLQRADPESLLDSRLLPVLIRLAQRLPVRILLWGGAPALVKPTHRDTREVKQAIDAAAALHSADLRCELDMTAHPSHCHHQKTVVIDGNVAFLGGMDITTFQGDRWDRSGHPLRAGLNWHDVQVRIEGEAVADVESNFRQRWEAVTRESLGLPCEEKRSFDSMRTPSQIVRTIPARTYDSLPRGEFGIAHAYLEMIRRARQLIYIENQYLWSPDIVDALITAMERATDPAFRIVIVLPARAYSGKWDNDRHVSRLREADHGRGRVEVYSLYASGPHMGVQPFRYRPIYVHAKIIVVDDEWFMVGSANLNTRGLMTDSEIGVLVHDPQGARDLRLALWAEHLASTVEEVGSKKPAELIDGEWRKQAAENSAIMKQADRPLPSNVQRYETGQAPGTWWLEEVETLTFEH